MGSFSAPKVKESEAEKADAEVSKAQWDFYKNNFRQIEDKFQNRMQQADSRHVEDKTVALGLNEAMAGERKLNPNRGITYQPGMARATGAAALGGAGVTETNARGDKALSALVGMGEKVHSLADASLSNHAKMKQRINEEKQRIAMDAYKSDMAGMATGLGAAARFTQSAGGLSGLPAATGLKYNTDFGSQQSMMLARQDAAF